MSGTTSIQIDHFEPASDRQAALLILYGSGGAASYWMDCFVPMVTQAGVALYAPHYFDKTRTVRPTMEKFWMGGVLWRG